MRKGLGFTLAWVSATIVAVVVAAAAVGSVRSQVTESPTALGAPTAVNVAAEPQAGAAPLGSTTVQPEVTSAVADPVDGSGADNGSATTLSSSSATTTTMAGSAPTTVPDSPPTTVAGSTPATVPTSPTTTIPGSTSTTSTTVVTTATTTTTTVPLGSEIKTYTTDGGFVRIMVSGESVTYLNAVPNTGWSIEVEDRGPDQVSVHFEHNDGEEHEVEFSAQVEDGRLVVSIS